MVIELRIKRLDFEVRHQPGLKHGNTDCVDFGCNHRERKDITENQSRGKADELGNISQTPSALWTTPAEDRMMMQLNVMRIYGSTDERQCIDK